MLESNEFERDNETLIWKVVCVREREIEKESYLVFSWDFIRGDNFVLRVKNDFLYLKYLKSS